MAQVSRPVGLNPNVARVSRPVGSELSISVEFPTGQTMGLETHATTDQHRAQSRRLVFT